jgi:sialidase-1
MGDIMSQPFISRQDLEKAGENGHAMYRVPGIVVTRRGTVLVYYDARNGEGENATQDLYFRRSVDNGQTFGERVAVCQGECGENLHNIVMLAETHRDTVHLFWHKNHRQCFHQDSFDDGLTWSNPEDITSVIAKYRPEYNWDVFSLGPGHGIQLKNGGLLVPLWMSNAGNKHRPSTVSCIYSDNAGHNWQRGEIIWDSTELINPSEGVVVQLNDGKVLMNIRHESQVNLRAITISKDGKSGWSKPVFDQGLPDPVCFGSIVRLSEQAAAGFDGILFSNCAWADEEGLSARLHGGSVRWSNDARRNLTVKLSLDECRTWSYCKLLEEQAGYSDLAVSPDGKSIFCIYEKEWLDTCINTKYLTLARFNVEWLSSGKLDIG